MDQYPETAAARDRFVLDRRGPRPPHDPWRSQGVIVEDERTAEGTVARVATVFLTGRECPWRCVMCDLWRYTTTEDTPAGAIPDQVAAARAGFQTDSPPVSAIKLYNAGSFFDPRAVPDADYDAVAQALTGLSHVVVESHPALIGERVARLLSALDNHRGVDGRAPRLEVAMGLETAHPAALQQLHKRFTMPGFARAAGALRDLGVTLRVFLLVAPPFIQSDEQDVWLRRSVDAAFDCGGSVVSLVPTRKGNGSMEALEALGSFRSPTLDDIERSMALALEQSNGRGRVFVDLWDLDRFAMCHECLAPRRARLHAMNLEQRILPPCSCGAGDHGAH